MGKNHLRCLFCGKTFFQDGFRLTCDENHGPSLLRSVYEQKTPAVRDDLPGMFKYADWLPVQGALEGGGAPVTYMSAGLAAELGLNNLFISFNGYWPERGAFMETCTFKELEAPPTALRLIENHSGMLVVASAGNTARAFAHICMQNKIPLCLIVPLSSLDSLWFTGESGGLIKLIALGGRCDYADAIQMANRISKESGFVNEGGILNVARRDGMGTVLIDSVLSTGEIPDHYFQAVGSGTGAISAWEANLRLIAGGRYGDKKARLHLSQNYPFAPLYASWKAGTGTLQAMAEEEAKNNIKQISAGVLSNRNPPYAITGGVYDALSDTGGEMYAVTNQELASAKVVFEKAEGIDIDSAAGVAVASLVQALKQGKVKNSDKILLNITGGGYTRLKQARRLKYLTPDVVLDDIKADIPWLIIKT
jgi:cysteate synthase